MRPMDEILSGYGKEEAITYHRHGVNRADARIKSPCFSSTSAVSSLKNRMPMVDTRLILPPQILDRIPKLKERWDDYRAVVRRATFPARAILLREGEIPRKIFFVEKGSLRVAINSHGKDITTQFFFEGDAVASIESFRANCPSPISIRSIEPTTVAILLKKDFERILKDFPETKDLLLEIAFRRFESYSRLFVSYLTQSPKQRYLALLEHDPRIVERIPQRYIASYLGITPVSLSRIRHKL